VQAPLYNRDIHDERGRAEQTPRGFAQLAIAQPEFERCMVSRVNEHVFGGEAPPAVVRELTHSFRQRHSLRDLMRSALLRYADQARPAILPVLEPPEDLPAAQPGDRIALPAKMRSRLDRHCGRCHSSSPRDYSSAALPRSVVLRMILAIASREMPRTAEGLPEAERRALARELTALVWPPGPLRDAALAFVSGDWRPLPGLEGSARGHMIARRVLSPMASTVTINTDGEELPDAVRRTPLTAGRALTAGIEALRNCATIEPRAACLQRALDLSSLVNAPLR
jgi:hypothetical protein